MVKGGLKLSDWAAPGTEADTPAVGPLGSLPGSDSHAGNGTASGPRPWVYSGVSGTAPADALGPFDHRGPTPLRPMTIGDILDNSFEVVKLRPRTVLLAHAALAVPLYLVLLVLTTDPMFIGGFVGPFSLPTLTDFSDRDLLALPILFAGPPFVTACAGVMMGRLVQLWYVGHEATSTELLKFLIKRMPAVIAAFVLIHLAEAVGLAAAGVGLFMAMAFFALTSPILGMEPETGPITAMKRSASLCSRRPGRVVAVLLVGAVVSLTLTYTMAPLSIGSALDGVAGRAIWALSGIVLLTVTAPIQGAMMVFLYLDIRVQAEGLDLELRAAEGFGAASVPVPAGSTGSTPPPPGSTPPPPMSTPPVSPPPPSPPGSGPSVGGW